LNKSQQVDRIVRVVIGIALLYVVATGKVEGIVMYVAAIPGVMMLITAAHAYYFFIFITTEFTEYTEKSTKQRLSVISVCWYEKN
jgi:hypothetical protein